MKILLSVLTGLLSLGHLQAKNMYVFSVTETKPFTNKDRQKDRATLEALSRDVARCAGYTLHWYDFSSGENFTPDVLEKTLKDFHPSSQQDIVWFHFAGQGFAGGKKAWPTIRLTGGNIPLRFILSELRKKDLRTLLVTTDCDNLFPKKFLTFFKTSNSANSRDWLSPDTLAVNPVIAKIIKTESADCIDPNPYTALFEAPQVKQIIILSSASPGQKAHRSTDNRSLWLDAISHALIATNSLGKVPSWKQLNIAATAVLSENTADQLPVFNRQTITCCEN